MTTATARLVAVVTGAASGIGAATARAFADRGWTVYATDIDTSFPPAVAADCRCLELDVTDSEACRAVTDRVLDESGRIDVLVTNAGYAVPGPVEDVSVAESRRQFDVVVHGTHAMIRAVLPAMRERNRGRIVVCSSVLGVTPSTGLGTYGAAKAAVESLIDTLRMELRGVAGVSVSLVEPAWVDTGFSGTATDRLPDGRTAAYDDVYETITDGWVVDGGPLAVAPERVADTVVAAATADAPAARYPVGRLSRTITASRLLPTGVLDTATPRFNRASVTARRCWEFVTGSSAAGSAGGGSEAASDRDSTVELSTGHEVSVPLSTQASLSGVVVSASVQEIASLLPSSLRPVRITPRRAGLVLMSVAYSRIGDSEIEPYNEVAIMVPAGPDSEGIDPPLVSALLGGLGGFVWQLPVTNEPGCALGREIWGYPKSIAEISITTESGRTETRLSADGQRVLSLAVERPPTRAMDLSLSSYSVGEAGLYRTPLTLDGELGVRPLSRRADWSLGEHPWAETLASLELGSRPLARFGGDCEFTIGTPQVVEPTAAGD